jgi:hypothetical protein
VFIACLLAGMLLVVVFVWPQTYSILTAVIVYYLLAGLFPFCVRFRLLLYWCDAGCLWFGCLLDCVGCLLVCC